MRCNFGPYVVVRPRADGTHRVGFEVPLRLRPAEWPATILLPRNDRNGNLDDPSECSRIREEAALLYAKFTEQKNGLVRAEPMRTWESLVALWQATSKFRGNSFVRQQNCAIYVKRILKHFSKLPLLHPATIKESDVEVLLSNWNHSMDMRIDVLGVMQLLMKKAIKEGWRTDNPCSEIVCKEPERHVIIWQQNDVDQLSAACVAAGQPGLSALIHAAWLLGQRLTDTRLFQHGKQYVDGVFRFHQSKTDEYVTIPATDELRNLLGDGKSDGEYLFVNLRSGQPFDEHELCMEFAAIRDRLPEYNDRRLRLRNLRHSCVVQLARADCTIPQIASITGHKYHTVHKIIERYLPRDNVLAFMAIKKREQMVESLRQAGVNSLAKWPPDEGLSYAS